MKQFLIGCTLQNPNYLNMKWAPKIKPATQLLNKLVHELQISPILAHLIAQNNVNNLETATNYIRPSLENLHDPYLMKDMNIAVDRILKAYQSREKVMLYGDFDVDGITSIAMLYLILNNHFENLKYYIPDRKSEGYGISEKGINCAKENEVSLLIVVDCGIRDVSQIKRANQLWIDVIVCDHHIVPEILPPAFAILNPKQKNCDYPFKDLCGCGVAFKLLQALSPHLNISREKILKYLDLVAIATTCDIVPIRGENRIMTHYGLLILNSEMRPGLFPFRKLIKGRVKIKDISHKIGPRINATGRVDHSHRAVELLTCQYVNSSVLLYDRINELNDKRRSLAEQYFRIALKNLKEEYYVKDGNTLLPNISLTSKSLQPNNNIYSPIHLPLKENYNKPNIITKNIRADGLFNLIDSLNLTLYGQADKNNIVAKSLRSPITFVYGSNWQTGVLGIIASRLIEKYAYKPTLVFSNSNGEIVGSGRSIEGFDIHRAVKECGMYLNKYGGHPTAVGMSLQKSNMEAFRKKLEIVVESQNIEQLPEKSMSYSIDLEFGQINRELYDEIQLLAPFGSCNEEPIFRTVGCIDSGYTKVVGKQEVKHLKFDLKDGARNRIRGIGFGMANKLDIIKNGPVTIYYTLTLNGYWNPPEVEIEVIDLVSSPVSELIDF